MISGLAHINLVVPEGFLAEANEFYGGTLGLTAVPVPQVQAQRTAWFDIAGGPQQVHIGFGTNEPNSSRHPCFRIDSLEDLQKLQHRIWEHHVRGGRAAPIQADQPGGPISGNMSAEFPTRFFARDFAGNRLEFSL
ncbi:Glyoxalase/Bleomycin resistance protein/Dihydroxybiphenyl dioxygenase [Aspergillus coremiiformis]|uniref:Glyoxalase/Bleomycin resistance protein/Dihydroxybiphenyl dioxygenase n=1 Tax=Aspergillus coremiiformis TaxID=138285 RepID=A0A5N6YUD4_9EURO|nr:Glyoxalase/Bleomycin resistance protein/Dihydroxybiphenyl dioxygenase [Aspergillus coremiiformis]